MKMVAVIEYDSEMPYDVVREVLREVLSKTQSTSDLATTGYLAKGPDARMVLDVFGEPELGGGLHVADVRSVPAGDLGWVIEHSLVCRRSGQMSDCPFIDHVRAAYDEELLEPGRWTLTILPQVGFTTPERLQLDREVT